ncbi:50S ribosomal protein L19 [Candidatus Daviesbacteria bacterium]|nr:50S ribosomal protein L19 [Candidatus Daviesbacteria bacterium]
MISAKFKEVDIHIGDTLRVKNTIVEGEKTRIQSFEGILISIQGRGENRTIKIRKIGPLGIGIERTWPLNARNIVDIQVVKKAIKVRRSKLYYLRNLTGKMATRV